MYNMYIIQYLCNWNFRKKKENGAKKIFEESPKCFQNYKR